MRASKYIIIAILILIISYVIYTHYLSYVEGLACKKNNLCERAIDCPKSDKRYTFTNKPNPSFKNNVKLNEQTNYPKLVVCN